ENDLLHTISKETNSAITRIPHPIIVLLGFPYHTYPGEKEKKRQPVVNPTNLQSKLHKAASSPTSQPHHQEHHSKTTFRDCKSLTLYQIFSSLKKKTKSTNCYTLYHTTTPPRTTKNTSTSSAVRTPSPTR